MSEVITGFFNGELLADFLQPSFTQIREELKKKKITIY